MNRGAAGAVGVELEDGHRAPGLDGGPERLAVGGELHAVEGIVERLGERGVFAARNIMPPELGEFAAVVGRLLPAKNQGLAVRAEYRAAVIAAVLRREVFQRAGAIGRQQVDVVIGKVAIGRGVVLIVSAIHLPSGESS